MLTITQDWILNANDVTEHASADGVEVFAKSGATCALAELLLKRGMDASEDVVLVRADPWLFPAPHRISGVSLGTVRTIDFFKTCPTSLFEELRPFQDAAGT